MIPRKLKILIITKSFPPQNAIAAHRPYSWAKYWSRAGHDVTVLTIPKIIQPQDAILPTEGFRVIEVPIPFWSSFLKTTAKSHRLSLPSAKSDRPLKPLEAIKNFLYKKTIGFLNYYGIFSACRMPDILDFWGKTAFQAVCGSTWDVVVSTAGPYAVHRPAYHLKKNGLATIWLMDWRDLWTEHHAYPGLPIVRSFEKILEKRWSLAADVITTVSEPLAERLRQHYGDKVFVIYNGFDEEEYEKLPPSRIFPRDGVSRIIYTGSIYKGYQDPSPLFAAVEQLSRQHGLTPRQLRIIFCGFNSDFTALAREHAVEAFVEYHGFLPRSEALRMQRDADALLFLEFESEEVKGILSGKLFEYLFAGPPILGIGLEDDSSVGQILKQTGRGVCLGKNVNAIKEKLLDIIRAGAGPRASEDAAIPDAIRQFSRKVQSQKMLNLLIHLSERTNVVAC